MSNDKLYESKCVFHGVYDPEYTFLNDNWNTICQKLGVTPKEVLLTDKNVGEETREDIILYDNLTSEGYCIRPLAYFNPCCTEGCRHIIVSESFYNIATEKGWDFLPDTWSKYCSECRE